MSERNIKQLERRLYECESRLTAIGQLTRSVGHELRNSLTIVKGYSEMAERLARQEHGSENLSDAIRQVNDAAERLGQGIDEIMDLARESVPQLELEAVVVRRYLGQILGPLLDELQGDGIEVAVLLDFEQDVEAILEPRALKEMLENLLTNARRAVLSNGGRKRVSLTARREGDRLMIRVADSGSGIGRDVFEKLRVPPAGKEGFVGVGLATVHNLARAHGGELDVETAAPEGGAAFTITLPLAPPACGPSVRRPSG